MVSPLRRYGVPLAGVLAVAVGLGWLGHRFLTDPTLLPPFDFLQYWAAGRLLFTGGNPYDADQLLALQAAAGWDRADAVMMWNPPWALGLFAPVGLLPWRVGHLLWLASQVGLVAGSGAVLWRVYGGRRDHTPLAAAAAVVTFPTYYLLVGGQCGGWLVAGVAGLLLAARTGRPWLGAVLATAAVKPHLLLPLWTVLALDAIAGRSRALLLWGVAGGLLLAVAPLPFDPDIWTQYLGAMRRPASSAHAPLSAWQTPVPGWWLRYAVAPDQFWVQALPTLIGVVAAVVVWRRRPVWDWPAEAPWLIGLCLLTAPYGTWPSDLTLLLVPAVAVAARGHARAVAVGGLVVSAATIIQGGLVSNGQGFVFCTPVVCLMLGVIARSGGRA